MSSINAFIPSLALAGLLAAGAAHAAPLPVPGATLAPEAVLVHHKPGHEGGPPWTRGRNARGYDDDAPRGYRSSRYDDGYGRRCTTQIRRSTDPYTGDRVTREVRICD